MNNIVQVILEDYFKEATDKIDTFDFIEPNYRSQKAHIYKDL